MFSFRSSNAMRDFVSESNRIEGILRPPTQHEIDAHHEFLRVGPSVGSLVNFVGVIQPDAALRIQPGMDVRVGRYVAPPGGPSIRATLENLLGNLTDPYLAHQAYEALHPFLDGNGRSGRVLWLWMMGGVEKTPLGFLHHWYYQSLQFHCGIRPTR